MNRFESRRSSFFALFRSAVFALFFIVLIFLFVIAVNTVDQSATAKQQQSLENAISRCITQCYAIEGTYPPSLEYMKQHYGLTYDDHTFFVDYQTYGSNIMPDVTVICKKE